MTISNEIGQKGRYSILQNAKGEIMLMMDSRVGGPENPRFIYDGGDKALLYRSQESSVAFNNIDKGGNGGKILKAYLTGVNQYN